MNYLYICILISYQIYDLHILSLYSVGCLFIWLMVPFSVQKLVSWMLSLLFIFAFVTFVLCVKSKKSSARPVKKLQPVFSSRSFMVSSLTFKSFIHFVFIFVQGMRKCPNLIPLHGDFQFSQHTYGGDCLFSIVYSCLFCCRLNDHGYIGLFLSFLIR